MLLHVNLGRLITIGVVATQDLLAECAMTEYKLGSSLDGASFSMTSGTEIAPSGSHNMAKKVYVAPFSACYVRFYPWETLSTILIEICIEHYAVATPF